MWDTDLKNDSYNRKIRFLALVWLLIAEVFLCIISNLLFLRTDKSGEGRVYRVELTRAYNRIVKGDIPDAGEYEYISDIKRYAPGDLPVENCIVVQVPDGQLYSVLYSKDESDKNGIYILNGVWLTVFLLTVLSSVYIYLKILKPFRDISELPFEISKGNMSVPVGEEKSRYFGRFLWGMDLLREHMEEEKDKNLALEKEKRTLVLSLSHDIKTPLSAIRLYNKALSEKLYDTEEKINDAHAGIERNVYELEHYVEDIRKAVREDLIKVEVKDESWYMSGLINALNDLYMEKTSRLHISYTVEPYVDCLLRGDSDRALEVLQNLMENAIKYGDGKSIKLSFADEEDCRLITVANTVNGFDSRELTNIFDPFYRGSNSGKQKGSGLGLYISRNLMRAMGTDIYAEVKDGVFLVTAVFKR